MLKKQLMFKIRLLILLLVSNFFLSCSNYTQNINKNKFAIDYISGEIDGLILKNLLLNNLQSIQSYDPNSNYLIKSKIVHKNNIYITNIDNTSDREKITTNLEIVLLDKGKNCKIFDWNQSISQFYIYASSEKQVSNNKARKDIKFINTEELVKELIEDLVTVEHVCEK